MGAVCDPIGDTELYLKQAQEHGMKIHYVIDTHVHADHVSSGRELAELTGAKYVLHSDAGASHEFLPVSEGERTRSG